MISVSKLFVITLNFFSSKCPVTSPIETMSYGRGFQYAEILL